nr:HAMP domain-containing sensor histidine kinase [uncultured Albidiferax sp.]
MKALLTPTLVRRIVAALLLAFALAWCAVATYTYLDFRANVRTHSGLQQAGRGLLDALAGIPRDELAINAVQVTAQQFNAVRRQDSQLPGDLLFQLRSTDGQELFASPPIAGQTLQGVPGQVADTRLNGQAYWLFTGQSGRWQLWMAEPQVSTQWVLQWIFDSLALPFLVAFPFVLVPVWIAATRGLKPLRMLGQAIEQRAAGDLSPLGVVPRYAELTPLVTALEDMLLQLRGKVARERSFVHDAAHELRTPLAVISAQAHVLSRTTDLQARAEASQHLQQAVARGSHLVQQLLELATMDAATHAPAQSVDVADLTRQHLAQATPHAASLGVELILDAPDSLPLALPVALYESVLRNLLDNAVKYAGGAGEVTLTLAWRDGALQLVVADSGPGVPAHEHALVFERFYRGTSASAAVSGTGLGLAIVRQACVRMGGDIALHSRSGGGCVFVATMPVAATAGG